MKKNIYWPCIISALYIILVSSIPILGFGAKGSGVNTAIKAIIFIIYLISFIYMSKFKLLVKGENIYILFSYLLGQVVGIGISKYTISILNVLIQTAMLFILLFVLPTITVVKRDIEKGIKIFIFFNVIIILYNIVIHIDRFINFSFLTNIYYDMYSIFDNKNTYGMILFVAFVLLFYWYYLCDEINIKKKKRIIYLMYFQFFAIATSMCRTALLCAMIFLACNYFKRITVKKIIIIFVVFIISGILFLVSSVREYLLYILLRVDVDTFREPIVEASMQLIRENFIFGCGQGGWNIALDDISGNPYSHNGFLSVLMTGGIVYFFAYILIILNCFKYAFKVYKYKFDLGRQMLISILTVLIYSFFESIVLGETNASNFAFTLVNLIIPQLYFNLMTKKSN